QRQHTHFCVQTLGVAASLARKAQRDRVDILRPSKLIVPRELGVAVALDRRHLRDGRQVDQRLESSRRAPGRVRRRAWRPLDAPTVQMRELRGGEQTGTQQLVFVARALAMYPAVQ